MRNAEHGHRRRLALAQGEQLAEVLDELLAMRQAGAGIGRVGRCRRSSRRRRRSTAKRMRRQPAAPSSSSRPMTSSAPWRSQPVACSASGSTTTTTSAARSAIAATSAGDAGRASPSTMTASKRSSPPSRSIASAQPRLVSITKPGARDRRPDGQEAE